MTNTFQALDKDSKFSSLKNISKTVDIIYKLALSMLKIFFPKETFLEAFGEIFWYVQGHVTKINLQDNPPPLSRFWMEKKKNNVNSLWHILGGGKLASVIIQSQKLIISHQRISSFKTLSLKSQPSKAFPRCLIHFLPTQTL